MERKKLGHCTCYSRWNNCRWSITSLQTVIARWIQKTRLMLSLQANFLNSVCISCLIILKHIFFLQIIFYNTWMRIFCIYIVNWCVELNIKISFKAENRYIRSWNIHIILIRLPLTTIASNGSAKKSAFWATEFLPHNKHNRSGIT